MNISKRLKNSGFIVLLPFLFALLTLCQNRSEEEDWEILFNGTTLDEWIGLGMDSIPANWKIEGDYIRNINRQEVPLMPDGQPSQGGDLMTKRSFENFELYFEWKISVDGNSGVKYNVSEEMSTQSGNKHHALGFEYQLLDDEGPRYKGNIEPSQHTAALYDLIPPSNVSLNPVGELNTSRIIVDGDRCEHWLNGIKVLEFEFGSDLLELAYNESKFNVHPGFHEKRKGHIILQNHSTDAWFKNIRIRELMN